MNHRHLRRSPLALLGLLIASGVPADENHRIGIDISHHSGDVDWVEVHAGGVHFAYVKATEGVDDADPMFEQHWARLKELEIPRGAYHFYVTEDDPEEQAAFFLSRIEQDPGDLPPVVDIELIGHGTTGELAPKLRRFLEIVEQSLGIKPAIYTSPVFWDQHLDDSFGDHPLWIAEYGVEAPRLPAGWERWALWQYAGDASVDGVAKAADLSRLHPEIDLTELRIGTGGIDENP